MAKETILGYAILFNEELYIENNGSELFPTLLDAKQFVEDELDCSDDLEADMKSFKIVKIVAVAKVKSAVTITKVTWDK